MNRTVLLASFIFPERLEWFLSYLETKFKISRDKVFIFKNLDDEAKLIVTFKLVLPNGKKIDFKKFFPNATLIHKKGDAIYTINALNKLIEIESGFEQGNVDHKKFQIDWSKYQGQMILTNKSNLVFINIQRIFS
jgi:hypothetical protein